jgi:hypothetical protein
MKKIILALDGEHFPHGAFEFAKSINEQNRILLAGVFLSPVDYSKLLAFTGMEGIAIMPEWLDREGDEVIASRNIKVFEDACITGGIEYRVHKDIDMMAISSLIEESRFADVLLVSSDLFYTNVQKDQPNFYLEEVLKKAECPVILVPEKFQAPGQTILAYDGNESSVFAIKQFAYLFPELAKNETILLSVTGQQQELPEYSLIAELAARHYPQLKMLSLPLSNRNEFTHWLSQQPDSYIVMGSFSRSLFSQLFKKSFAGPVIQEIKMPIFISHK